MHPMNSKEKILQAATQVFSEKSFEGSRIDEIAKEAEVPKSLIYYHFKSKEEIFEILLSNFIEDYMKLLEGKTDESHLEKANTIEERLQTIYYVFGEKNEDIIRVILIDALKKTKGNTVFFKIIDLMTKSETQNKTEEELQERRIAEFFTAFLPCCAYFCFAEGWTTYFKLERHSFDTLFSNIYKETHGAYHKNHK